MLRALAILLIPTAATAAESTPADQGPWWLGPLVTFVAAVIGASAIVWQLGRQHRNESQRQAENFKSQLKLQVYQEFSVRLSTATDSVQTVAMYAFAAPSHILISKMVQPHELHGGGKAEPTRRLEPSLREFCSDRTDG